jgi:acyl-CoA synthetase (AMP-forming)/AMP-acid ligase II
MGSICSPINYYKYYKGYTEGISLQEEAKPKNWPEYVPPTIDYPKIPLFGLLDSTAERHPDVTAMIFQDNRISYRELKDQVDRFATALQDLGVARGDRVALYLANMPQFVIGYYGALKAGAIVTAISPLYRERDRRPW